MVWIHGGGYGTGQGNTEFWELLSTNDNGFILVLIQYRLGAFGWLSSEDLVKSGGIPNAGLHDMRFSLQWVQSHISKFGGDPDRVTISGESAGAGAVMLLAMTNGGGEGTSLFSNAITASPYLPTQWDYNGLEPTQAYKRFAAGAGCADSLKNHSALDCLVAADTITLQNTSAHVSGGYKYGQWVFVPVTDTDLLTERPSTQLNAGRVNGLRMLTSNNADEGQGFVPQNITSATNFEEFVTGLFPLMSSTDIDRLLEAYSIAPVIQGPLFSTLGDTGPTSLNQSEFATGQQQRANNLYAETTFVCPSYWLANAYSKSASGVHGSNSTKGAWKYQFSVPPSEHGADLDAYQAFNRETLGKGTMTAAARQAVQLAWGRFIIHDDPTLPEDIIRSLTTSANGTSTGENISAISSANWSRWSVDVSSGGNHMLNVNMTGGVPEVISWTPVDGTTINVTQMVNPGLEARFRMVNANSWEGGRGERCRLWQSLGAVVPE
ncbi:alpha/beta-hydrolase [Cryphonectria parasitica EP155]|uniref:Carboxylic ester hydrolase n=1 Tax=Cryphonectria parasitica (strain ATCC 38755 / EP155) TaxID=660469 RepID=A0A9P4XZP6_CRYP1|nr:alpha/beta-hydrolase [Cryphonectria parasitica EP155]KAF3763722.1 alpha/beta-hydrolase [Cryphonectria parasitica EP155]